MAGSRTLKLSILADVDDLNKKLKAANNDVGGFTGQLDKFGKMAAAAFAAATAAAAAYAGKIAIDGVKAAIADEAAQKRLATALESATGATREQIKATEDSISKMQSATGVADDELRSAMGRLALSTNSVTKSQELLSLALDISKARGIPLEGVANALGKAYDGQTTALTRLGLGLSSAELKGLSFEQVQKKLNDTFGGAASAAANTYQGRLDRLKVTYDEAVEAIGYRLLPIIEKLLSVFLDRFVPALSKVSTFFEPLLKAIRDNKESFQAFGEILEKYVLPLLGTSLVAALRLIGTLATNVINILGKVAGAVSTAVNAAIAGIKNLIELYNKIPVLPNIKTSNFTNASFTNASNTTLDTGANLVGGSGISNASTGGGGGGGVVAGTSTVAKSNEIVIRGRKVIIPQGLDENQAYAYAERVVANAEEKERLKEETARIREKIAARARGEIFGSGNSNVTVNIGVAGDPEGTARAVVDVLNQSSLRGTGGSSGLI